MSAIVSFFRALWTHLHMVLCGLAAVVRVIGIGLGCLIGRDGTIASRLKDRFTAPEGQRLLATFARAFVPNIAFSAQFITAYDNSGTAIVTRFEDVKDVLHRDGDFEVVYGPRMAKITAGRNFFLGMQDSADYTRDTSNMRLAVRREDLETIVRPFAVKRAGELVAATKGRIDVPQDLTLRVQAQLLATYFGIPGPSEAELIAWTTIMFWYLFIDLNADPSLDAHALDAAAKCRAYLDGLIAARKSDPTGTDDVLERCLVMQKAGLPGMDDLGIRDNLIGLIIGAVPTISKACVQALDRLLADPKTLAGAQAAARSGDDSLLAAYAFEALRFNPVNPLVYRRAARDTTIAPNTLRSLSVAKGTMVLAVNLSAMFDPLKLASPNAFRTDRPWDDYILWGDGMHTCFGAHMNRVLIPSILKPLLAQKNLRRAADPLGAIDTEGTPFPVHMWLEFDP